MYTTYTQLAGSSITNQAVAFTGSVVSYGVNTPIDLGALAASGQLQTAMSALPYVVGSWVPTAQTISIKMIEEMLYIWNAIFPGDDRAQRLTYYVEKLIAGEPVVPTGQMTDLVNTLIAQVAAMPQNGTYTKYNFLIVNFGPMDPALVPQIQASYGLTFTQESLDNPTLNTAFSPIESNSTDPYANEGVLITDAIAKQLYVQDTFLYSQRNAELYYLVTSQNPTSPATLTNYETDAATNFVQALALAVNQSVYSTAASISAIYALLRSAQVAYNNLQQYILRPILAELGQANTGRVPIAALPDPAIQPYAKQITDAGLNLRAQLLSDYTFVIQFDTNGSNKIEAAERIAMETAVQVQVQAVQLTTSQNLFNVLYANFVSYSTAPDPLLPIFVEYAS